MSAVKKDAASQEEPQGHGRFSSPTKLFVACPASLSQLVLPVWCTTGVGFALVPIHKPFHFAAEPLAPPRVSRRLPRAGCMSVLAAGPGALRQIGLCLVCR